MVVHVLTILRKFFIFGIILVEGELGRKFKSMLSQVIAHIWKTRVLCSVNLPRWRVRISLASTSGHANHTRLKYSGSDQNDAL